MHVSGDRIEFAFRIGPMTIDPLFQRCLCFSNILNIADRTFHQIDDVVTLAVCFVEYLVFSASDGALEDGSVVDLFTTFLCEIFCAWFASSDCVWFLLPNDFRITEMF